MIRTRTFLAAVVLHTAYSFDQVRWTRDDLFLNPSGIPADGVTSFAVADMDGDSLPDFALIQNGALYLYRQVPEAFPRFQIFPDYFKGITFLKASDFEIGSGIALYDFDGDGVKNPITFHDGTFVYWRNAGNRRNPLWQADIYIDDTPALTVPGIDAVRYGKPTAFFSPPLK